MTNRAWKAAVDRLPRGLRALLFSGSGRYCPVCDSRLRRFIPIGSRRDAVCPMCGAYERHRLTWLFLREHTDLFDGRPKRVLHVAPERSLGARIQALPNVEYVSADIADPRAMLRFDVTDIPLPDHDFDVIMCSHVLEHVHDDARAMRELARVLRPDGWALLEVPPLRGDTTYEDPTIVDPHARARAFGQADHVRVVGQDYPDRIRANGWTLERWSAPAVAAGHDPIELGLMLDEEVFLCRPISAGTTGSRRGPADDLEPR